jgi:tetratricopeptide (TPR) repeat protein
MGRVYAGRELTLDREVAIKMLLPGANTDRFLTEAKITAQLPHPAIPPVYALGLLADGRPYLVMKRIRGRTLSELLSERTSCLEDLPRWVQIFEQIAQAVGFAHSQGILHRDLKPLNVMVGAFGEVQVMDWGLAKDTKSAAIPGPSRADKMSDPPVAAGENPTLAEQYASGSTSSHTRVGAILGTLGYMAPEQARGEEVDSRADVFALGAMLSVLLTGHPLFTHYNRALERTAQAEFSEVYQRLDNCGADPALIALARRCLAARREDRPSDARAVAEEVSAYRATVEARLRKAETATAEALVREAEQAKRRRQQLWAAWAITLTLVAGIVGTTFGLLRANSYAYQESQARQLAEEKTLAADLATLEEKRAKEQAQAERDAKELQRLYANGIADFVLYDFLAFTSTEGRERFSGLERDTITKDTTLTDLLDRAASKLQSRNDLDPRTVATLSWMIGVNYRSMGNNEQAIRWLEKAYALRREHLGLDDEDTLQAGNSLGVAFRAANRPDDAVAVLKEVAQRETRVLGQNNSKTLSTLSNLAGAYRQAGQTDQAIDLFNQVVVALSNQKGASARVTLSALMGLALSYRDTNRLSEATKLLEQTSKLAVEVLGPGHSYTLSVQTSLSELYHSRGKTEQALALLEPLYQTATEKLGPDDAQTLQIMESLAALYRTQGRTPDVIRTLELLRERQISRFGPDDSRTLETGNNLGLTYTRAGRLKEAIALLHEVSNAQSRTLGPKNDSTLTALDNLGHAYLHSKQFERAADILEKVLKIRQEDSPRNEREWLITLGNLTFAYRELGRIAEAIPLAEQSVALRKKTLGVSNPQTIQTLYLLAQLYRDHRQGESVAKTLRELVALQRPLLSAQAAEWAGQLAVYGYDLLTCQQYAAAEELLSEALPIRQKLQPGDWRTFNMQSMLGGSLLGQKKYDAAEPLLMQGYKGMVARVAMIPPPARLRLTEAVDRLISLYQATGNQEAVTRWQAERLRVAPPLPMPRELVERP